MSRKPIGVEQEAARLKAYSIRDAAVLMALKPKNLYQLTTSGEVEYILIRKMKHITAQEIERWLTAAKHGRRQRRQKDFASQAQQKLDRQTRIERSRLGGLTTSMSYTSAEHAEKTMAGMDRSIADQIDPMGALRMLNPAEFNRRRDAWLAANAAHARLKKQERARLRDEYQQGA